MALLTSVTLGIVTRAGDDPLIWTDELSRFLMVWLAGFGWIVSTRRRGHVRIRFFHDLMPSRAWRATELLVQLGMAALGAVVAWCGWYLVGRNSDLDATTLPVSMAWMYVPLIPAGVVTLMQGLWEAAEQVQRRPEIPAADMIE